MTGAIANGWLRRWQLDRVVGTLVRFYRHASAELIAPTAYVAGFQRSLAYDLRILLDPRFRLPAGMVRHIACIQRQFLTKRTDLLAERVRRRHIVEGHGDLRPEHIFLGDPIRIIDCLEFNARLRMVDPLDEIAFLCVECERLGAPGRQGICSGALPTCSTAVTRMRFSPSIAVIEQRCGRASPSPICSKVRLGARKNGLRWPAPIFGSPLWMRSSWNELSKDQEITERITGMQTADSFGQERRHRQDIELGTRGARTEPECRNGIGNDNAVKRRIRKRLRGARHEETMSDQGESAPASGFRAARAARTIVPPVLTRSSTISAVAPATSPTKRSPDTTPALRRLSAKPFPIGRPSPAARASWNSSARLAPPPERRRRVFRWKIP